jgi:hypothetical protein
LDAADPEARKNVEYITHGEDSFNQTHAKEDHDGHDYEDLIDLVGNGDVSDAGMVFYAIIDEKDADRSDVKDYLAQVARALTTAGRVRSAAQPGPRSAQLAACERLDLASNE